MNILETSKHKISHVQCTKPRKTITVELRPNSNKLSIEWSDIVHNNPNETGIV